MTYALGVAVPTVCDNVRGRAAFHSQDHRPSTGLNALPHPMVIGHVAVSGTVWCHAGAA